MKLVFFTEISVGLFNSTEEIHENTVAINPDHVISVTPIYKNGTKAKTKVATVTKYHFLTNEFEDVVSALMQGGK